MPILIFIAVVYFRLFYFQQSILPRHDTFIAYSTFYHFYNHLYYYNTFPQWMPKITYGIPSLFFQFFSLSPLSYCVMLPGKIFHVTDVMLLFKLTVLFEETFFVLGLYALIRTLFKDRWIATAISLAAIISMESYSNIFFNLRIFYFVPVVLLLLWKFIEREDPKYFWMMLLASVLGLPGNAIYLPIVTCYLTVVIIVFLFTVKKIKWSSLWPRDILTTLTAAATGVLILIYGLAMFKSSADLSLIARDNHARNSMDIFLHHGGTMNFWQLFFHLFFKNSLYSPLGAALDNTLYVGMITGIFFIMAVIYCRDLFFQAVLAGLIFVVLFSLGGLASRIFYFLPGMSLYRHIGLTGSLIKLLVIISAGFGLKYLFEQKYWSKPWDAWVKAAIVLVLIIEAVIFQNSLKQDYPKADPFIPEMMNVFTHVRPAHFDATRLDNPPDARWPMMTMIQKYGRGCNYVTMFNALDFDTCHTDTQVQVVNKSVLQTWKKSQDNQETNYQKIAGCNGLPKYVLLNQLPLAAGEDIYREGMPFEAEVVHFDADNVVFKTSSIPQSGWFYYADAFHPGWRAVVNGEPSKVQETADGFKAVAVDAQTHSVEFHFFDMTMVCLQYLLCFGAIIGLGLLLLRTYF